MYLEKRNDPFVQVLSICNFVPVAILMIRPSVFLEIHISASEKFFELIENALVFLNKLQVESRFYFYSPFCLLFYHWIADVHSKASFAVYQSNDVIRIKHNTRVNPSPSPPAGGSEYYDSADF